MALTASNSSGAITTGGLLGITDSNGIIHLPVVLDYDEARRRVKPRHCCYCHMVRKVRQMMVDGLITHAPLVSRFIVVLLLEMGIMIVLLSMSQRFVIQADGLTQRFF